MKEKMKFEEFKEAVATRIKDWLPEQFATADVSLQVFTKNNSIKFTGLTIKKVDKNIAPTIYLEGFYEHYMEGTEMPVILKKIADIRMEHDVEDEFDVGQITNFENCREKIFPRLIGAGWNKDILAARPHVMIEDLAVIFSIDLGGSPDQKMSVPVNYGLSGLWQVSPEELYEIAVDNLTESCTGSFFSLSELIIDMMLPDMIEDCNGDREEAEQKLKEMFPESDEMYVLTNKDRLHGASAVLDRCLMQRVVNRIGETFYILPSSIHEVMVVPSDEEMDTDALITMVREINASSVDIGDRLSNNIYRYEKDEGIKLVK